MSSPSSPTDAPPSPTPPSVGPGLEPGPLRVAMSPAQVVEALDKAARRGKLAGFRNLGGGDGGLFAVEAWGTPFEGELIAEAGTGEGATTTLSFRTRMLPRWPWVFGVVLVLSVWPGVVLTKSVLSMMVPGWGWLWQTTWYWYLPLSIIGGVWGWVVAMKRSRVTMAASSQEMAEKVRGLLGAKVPPREGTGG